MVSVTRLLFSTLSKEDKVDDRVLNTSKETKP